MSRAPLPLLALLTFTLFILLAIPGVTPWYLGPAAALDTLLTAAPFALAYMLAAMGWGTRLDAMWRGAPGAWAIQLGVGLAIMFFLSHLMGVAGLFRTGTSGLVLAWLPIAIGVVLLATSASRKRRKNSDSSPVRATHTYLLLAGTPALAVLLLAACVPPGTLWTSEARGFDALSYHLQLPREWLAQGRLHPLEHNAYSWLPSYVEAAYMHLGAMTTFLARDPFTQSDGPATIASQLLHALMAISAAICVAALVFTILRKLDDNLDQRRFVSTLAALLFLTTPWVIVTGSLAYNEMAVCLFLAAALIVCETESLTPARRGTLIGLLVGAACSAKPTALFMVGTPVGILLLIRTPRRDWVRTLAAATAVGLLILAPWLTRNAMASGNPVFPYLASIFGDGHWSPLEVARWNLGHHESVSISSRILLLISNRGFGHELWGPIAAVGGSTGLLLLLIRYAHKTAFAALLILAVQVSLWLGIGHLQSRFLLPTIIALVIPIATLASLALARWRRSTSILVGLAITAASCAPPLIMLRETRRAPAALVIAGIPFMTGESIPRMEPTDPEARRQLEADLAPHQWINLIQSNRITRLYLLGDSTPFYYHLPVLYHTTWDHSPLGTLLRVNNGNLAQAAQQLAAPPPKGFGISHVLINFSELHRLHSDHWYDPDATPAIAEALIANHARIIKEWQPANNPRIVLIELVPNSP